MAFCVPANDSTPITLDAEHGIYPTGGGNQVDGNSLFALITVFTNIANGNWAGPPSTSPTRPLSFRKRLAAAAA